LDFKLNKVGKQASKQASTQAGRQAGKQASKQASKQANDDPRDHQISRYTYREFIYFILWVSTVDNYNNMP
jgi:hypothetical protein